MAESFGAVSFDVLWDDPFTTPLPDRRNAQVVRKPPFGTVVVVQDYGPDATEITYRVELTKAAHDALDAMRAALTPATLDVGDDSPRAGALLRAITDRTYSAAFDLVRATLTFMVP